MSNCWRPSRCEHHFSAEKAGDSFLLRFAPFVIVGLLDLSLRFAHGQNMMKTRKDAADRLKAAEATAELKQARATAAAQGSTSQQVMAAEQEAREVPDLLRTDFPFRWWWWWCVCMYMCIHDVPSNVLIAHCEVRSSRHKTKSMQRVNSWKRSPSVWTLKCKISEKASLPISRKC